MFYWQFLKIIFSLVDLFWFDLAYCQMRVGGYLQISVFLAGGYQLKAYLSKCVTACSVASDSLKAPWTIACQVSLSMQFPRQEY